jgi:hypothetical protein
MSFLITLALFAAVGGLVGWVFIRPLDWTRRRNG